MVRTLPKPPPVIANARVLEYAVLDSSVHYSGHSLLFVDGRELGPVPCLTICQELKDARILLLHCERDWTVLGTVEFASVAQAKDRAERIYPGVAARWIEMQITEQEALKYLNESSSDLRCQFCGRRPDEVEQIIEKGGSRICDSCIREFHQMLQEGSSA
jgi:hypothetical protein